MMKYIVTYSSEEYQRGCCHSQVEVAPNRWQNIYKIKTALYCNSMLCHLELNMLLLELREVLPAWLHLAPTHSLAHESLKPQSSLSQDSDIASIYFTPWVCKIALLHPTKTGKAHRLSSGPERVQRQSWINCKSKRQGRLLLDNCFQPSACENWPHRGNQEKTRTLNLSASHFPIYLALPQVMVSSCSSHSNWDVLFA